MLESAIDRTRNLFLYDEPADIADMASVLILGIARNHPFEQCNKRTGFVAGQLFLDANGYALDVPDNDAFGNLILRTLSDTALDGASTSILRRYCVPTVE